jgi:hypothetical protein
MSSQKSIQVRIGEVILFSKQLVLVKHSNDHQITLEDVKEQIDSAVKITGDGDFAVILDGGNTLDVSDEAMTYAARFKKERWKAFAIVVRSISERLFANYFLTFKKPVRPTKVFTSPAGAEKWLKEYIKIERPVGYKI